jgi:DUF2914 family protein
MKRIFTLLVLSLLAARGLAAQDTTGMAAPAAPSLTVEEAVVARSVMDRQPQDTGSMFPADVGELVFWTKVGGGPAGVETTIHHVWFHGDTEVGNVELRVGGSPWRTWSRKTVPPDWTGPWHVEVRDGSGAVLTRVDFTVGQ